MVLFLTLSYQELKNVTPLFERLKQNSVTHAAQNEVEKRLANIVEQVEKMKKEMEDKLKQITGSRDT